MKRICFLFGISLFIAACGSSATLTTPTTVAPLKSPTWIPSIAPSMEIPTMVPTVAPTQSFVRVSPNDGMTQLFVPEGSVYMGGLDIFAENDEKPAHHVQLSAFWMDQVEVTNGMYGLCVQAGVCSLPTRTRSDNREQYFGNPEFRDYPVVNVTWSDAQTYCEWAARRLPTEAEWERAARGEDMRTYPWGDEPPNASLGNFNNVIGDTSRVGSYAAGASPFGVLDMAGNVWEWVSDFYGANYYAESVEVNPTGPAERNGMYFRVIRGGSYQDERVNLRVSNRGYELGPNPTVLPDDPAYYGASSVKIGFRCAADP